MRTDVSPAPYQENLVQGTPNTLASFSWLEWFRQLRDFVVEFKIYKNYVLCSSETSQTPTAVDTPKAIGFESNPVQHGITRNGTKVYAPYTGLYKFSFSTQVTSTSSSTKTVWFWPRVNGVDVSGFTMRVTINSNNATIVLSRSGFFPLNEGDYLEAWWATDSMDVELTAFPATAFAPATPSALLEVLQIG